MNSDWEYVFSKEHRFMEKFSLILWIVITWPASVALYVFAILYPNRILMYLAFAILFTGAACWGTRYYIRALGAGCFKFSVAKSSVANMNEKKDLKNIVYLDETYYLTKINIEIALGKGSTVKLPHVLFSQKPFLKQEEPFWGIQRSKRLAEQHIVFIPLNDRTETWLADESNIVQIPEYPKVMCKMVKMEDPGDSLNLWQ